MATTPPPQPDAGSGTWIVFGACEGQWSITDEEWAESDVALWELWDKDLEIKHPSDL